MGTIDNMGKQIRLLQSSQIARLSEIFQEQNNRIQAIGFSGEGLGATVHVEFMDGYSNLRYEILKAVTKK